ncbi:hypothetical protein AALK46_12555 [Staphylococcus nepalensis]|uniref:hypothetical protein n=1 Tax=Staphylococcus TaxID=1279 RepID=UPI002DB7F5A0|nr:hypothetical protein [Staphylococcus pseudoxylosus]MEB6038170.1 hypothetical protein [Staphylococcus pseudoxylosus]
MYMHTKEDLEKVYSCEITQSDIDKICALELSIEDLEIDTVMFESLSEYVYYCYDDLSSCYNLLDYLLGEENEVMKVKELLVYDNDIELSGGKYLLIYE